MKSYVLRSSGDWLRPAGQPVPPDGLAAQVAHGLTEHGWQTETHQLSSTPGGGWTEQVHAAAALLAAELSEDGGSPGVLHALDPLAAAAALVVRRDLGWPVVVRSALTGPGARSPLAALAARAADAVLAPTTHEAVRARGLGVPAERVVLCPDQALVAEQAAGLGGDARVDADRRPSLLVMSGVPSSTAVRRELLTCLVQQRTLCLRVASPGDHDVPLRRRFQAEADAAGVGDRVVLVGTADGARLIGLVDDAQVVVASRAEPTCSLAALVAMHRARPVVSVPSPSADDVLVDGVTGLIVDGAHGALSHALVALCHNRFDALSLGVAGQDRARARFAGGVVISGVLTAYDRAA